jgi:Xaa-Pro aminopeptidase
MPGTETLRAEAKASVQLGSPGDQARMSRPRQASEAEKRSAPMGKSTHGFWHPDAPQVVASATGERAALPSYFGKMRAQRSALAIVALSAATTLTSGRADPPRSGQAINFLEPMVLCKTQRELKELVDALRISVEAYDAKLKQLGVDRSECDVNAVSHVFVVESQDLGVVDFNHARRRVWIVHFTNTAKDGWGLYEEAVAAIASNAAFQPKLEGFARAGMLGLGR